MAFLNIINGDASAVVGAEWTADPAGTGKVIRVTNANASNGFALAMGNTADPLSYQDVAITDPADLALIAAGRADFILEYACSSFSGDADEGGVGIEFYGSGSLLLRLPNGLENWPDTTFQVRGYQVAVPVGTDTVRFIIQGDRRTGTECSAYVDYITGQIVEKQEGVELPIINPFGLDAVGAEWVANPDGNGVVTTEASRLSPFGTRLVAGNSSTPSSYQSITLTGEALALVQGSDAELDIRFLAASLPSDPDLGGVGVTFLDNGGTVLAAFDPVQVEYPDEPAYTDLTQTYPVPSGTREIRIEFDGTRLNGAQCSAYITNLRAFVRSLTPPPNAHRYWRILIIRGLSGSGSNIAELDLRSVSGGTNLALGKTATASSVAGPTFVAANATDGSATTFWDSGGILPCSLSVDLGAATEIVEVAITVRPDAFVNSPRTFAVQSSDDNVTWRNEWYVADTNIGRGLTRTFTRPPATDTARHWGMWINEAGGSSCAMSEVELRSSPNGPDFTGSGVATTSSRAGAGFSADFMFDDNFGSAWDAGSKIPAYWAYDLGVGQTAKLQEVAISARRDSFFFLGPTNAEMMYSDDGEVFGRLEGGDIIKSSWTSSTEQAIFTFVSAPLIPAYPLINVIRYRKLKE